MRKDPKTGGCGVAVKSVFSENKLCRTLPLFPKPPKANRFLPSTFYLLEGFGGFSLCPGER